MKIQLIKGDITLVETEAMVNAANSGLAGGGGVDGAIHHAGGPGIMDELDKIRKKQGGCPTGEAVVTTAGRLPARKVIHAVGPVWKGGDKGEPEQLRQAYFNSMKLAEEHDLAVVSFPNISTGIYGFPKEQASEIAIETIREFGRHTKIEKVLFICFDEESYRIYEQKLTEKGLF